MVCKRSSPAINHGGFAIRVVEPIDSILPRRGFGAATGAALEDALESDLLKFSC